MEAGAAGLWERERGGRAELVAWFAERTDRVPSGGRWEVEPARDWLTAWRAGLEPVTVGRLRIVPTWLHEAHTAGGGHPTVTTVVLDPGMAFGTGHHATTRLCLRTLQRSGPRGRSVLDVGTGSGILAIAAAKLGAARIVAVDTDPDAVAAARDNVRANEVAVDVRRGSVEVAPGRPSDLVLANLTTDTVIDLAGALVAAARRTLVVSGVGLARVDEARDALRAAGAGSADVETEGEWAALRVTPVGAR